MSYLHISRNALSQFSAFSSSFGDQSHFEAFLEQPFLQLSDLSLQANKKKHVFTAANRRVLVAELTKQLQDIASEEQLRNLALLKSDNTFTVTTGHQLTLFGGPLYLIYKVLHVVKLATSFNELGTEHKLVPVFWMASEDHDIDEVRYTHLFNRKLIWETEQSGPVGRMNQSDFQTVFEQFSELFIGKETIIQELLAIPFQDSTADYHQLFLTKLFAAFGVLVIQPDTIALKQLFIPVLKREISNQVSLPQVEVQNAALKKAGWNPQAVARACNLFYLKSGERLRIDPVANGFAIDGEVFSENTLIEMVEKEPHNFSPNVILRPVYQETILPNLAYIGGGGEMAYWIQLKAVFAAHDTLYPLIQQRNSLHLVDAGTRKRIEKLGWDTTRFFQHKDQLRKEYLQENNEEALDLTELNTHFDTFRLAVINKAKQVDVSLESFAEAETVRMKKQLESFEQRLVKQVKQQHEQSLKSIDFICDRFLPENTLQERYFHWLHFAPNGDYQSLLNAIFSAMNPFESDLIVVELSA